MATTYDGYNDIPSASPKANTIVVMRAVADFQKHNLAASDMLRILKIPAGTVILGGMYKIVTGEGAATAIDVGYAASSAAVKSSLSVSTAGSWTKVTAPKFTSDSFKEYASDGYIVVTAGGALDRAQVMFQFYCAVTTEDMVGY